LAERLEDRAGIHAQSEADLAQLALSVYGHRLSAGSGASP
jgi:hypothetical protein